MGTVQTWIVAARAFAELIEELAGARWEAQALGVWSLRDLVGHATSAGVNAVATTLQSRAATEDIATAEGYYAFGRSVDRATYDAAVAASTEDARHMGWSLGDHPGTAVRSLVEKTIAEVGPVEETTMLRSAAGGMRLGVWLPTRTFELAVHSLDISAAAGLPARLPDDVLADALALAGRIAAAAGDGNSLLLALTGRQRLPEAFSVV